MSTAGRIGGFAVAIAVVFAGSWGLGGALGPDAGRPAVVDSTRATGQEDTGRDDTAHDGAGHDGIGHGATQDGDAGAGTSGSVEPAPLDTADSGNPETASAGLTSTRAGYSLVPTGTVLTWQQPTEVAFTITGSDGTPITAFDDAGGQSPRMDAAVVRRDDAGYTRLSATQGPDGVWRAPVTFPGAGVWRLYAGFTPTGGPRLDLGTDLYVPGPFGPFTFSGEQRTVATGDYQVRLDGGLLPGGESRMFATISRNGAPVTDVAPMPGADGVFGRMVAVRQGDLARFPLRPEITGAAQDARSGPGVGFVADVPSTGSYRLFLTFTHDGTEHACEFTVGTPTGS